MFNVSKFIRLFASNPTEASVLLKAFLRGTFTALLYRFVNRRVRIAFPFFMYEAFRVTGPGKVFIGKYCSIYPNMFDGVSIVTLDPNAEVHIGVNCSLGGVTIRCRERIEIGDYFLSGYSLIQDCILAESMTAEANEAMHHELASQVIRIGRNVWIGAQSCILPGTKIDDDSVVSLGTVCYGTRIEEYQLAAGNPCLRPMLISSLMRMQGVHR